MVHSYTTATQVQLQRMFDTCVIAEEKYSEVDDCLKQIVKHRDRYHSVSHKHDVPWHLTGIIHATICDCNFKNHLHNGDSLNGRTTSIPVGYPKRGRPPFTWEQSAEDAFQFYGLMKWSDWSIPGILYNLEMINRDDYVMNEVRLLKLWSFSNHTAEDSAGADIKCGSAILLRRMAEKQLIPIESGYSRRLAEIKKLGSEVQFAPSRKQPKTYELQRLLNMSGSYLREDGRAGKFTAHAYLIMTGSYLPGDPDNK